jgi:hypothetical protein
VVAPEMNTLNTMSTDEKSYIQVIVNGQVESAQVRGHHRVVPPSRRYLTARCAAWNCSSPVSTA